MSIEVEEKKQQFMDEIQQKEKRLEKLEAKSNSLEYDIAHIKTLNDRDDKKSEEVEKKLTSRKEFARNALITFCVGVLIGAIVYSILRLTAH
jgi:F0F1-type ATP synthase assembly protein I